MDVRASDTLAWFYTQAAEVASHEGAAFAEVEILGQLVNGTPSVARDVLSVAYMVDATRRVPDLSDRAKCRAFAHAVMFATNFGGSAIVLPAGTQAAIESVLLAHDLDTMGELLIAAKLAGYTSLALAAAKSTFDAEWEAVSRVFDNYHVILVGALLYAVSEG